MINLAGSSIIPTIAGIQSAISDFSASFANVNQNSFYTNIVDGPSATSYPIVGFTYLVFKFEWPADLVQQYETFRFFHWAMQVAELSHLGSICIHCSCFKDVRDPNSGNI